MPDLLTRVAANAHRLADAPAIDSPSEGRLTWGDLGVRMDELVAGFRARGRVPGEAIGIGVYRGTIGIQLYLAAQAAGLRPVLLGIGLGEHLVGAIRTAGITELFCGPELTGAPEAAAATGIPLFTVDGPAVLAQVSGTPDATRNWVERTDDEVSAIQYSTGTTGVPKGMVRSVGADFWDAVNRNLCMRTRHSERWICASPTNINVAIGALRCMILMGGCIVALDEVSPETIELASRDGVTILPLQAPGWRSLLASGVADLLPERGLRVAVSTGQRTPGPIMDALGALVGDRGEVVNSYGLTETSTIATLTSSMPAYGADFVAGTPAPLANVEVAPFSGAVADAGSRGEIRVRGVAVSPGYVLPTEEGQSNVGTAADGWFYTGDVGDWNPDGTLSVLGRWKDALVVAGKYVFPYELETLVGNLPGVDEVVVLDDGHGLAVVVQPAAGAVIDAAAVRDAVAGRAPVVPSVSVIDIMPRNSSSKINRGDLRELLLAGSSRLSPLTDPEQSTVGAGA
ncbi:class I adenylate-forming enzyme family protein [Nakamurella alba]|uniref:class I adenylate-forming enzyme family protein n=1 Tax=Nakamurella alba TaxID=2665158 RepID=UPI0018AB7D5E|nr:class I adenylate-forming enzyme family protein [Nakamurella alba]